MVPSSVLQLVMLGVLAGGCAVGAGTPPSPNASAGASAPSVEPTDSASPAEHVPLPSGFPILPGAASVVLPNDDSGLIGLWSSDRPGSAAYDFYATALPAAGYPIVGLYPGGAVALIRFGRPDGSTWQMVAHDAGDGTVAIEIRLDRP